MAVAVTSVVAVLDILFGTGLPKISLAVAFTVSENATLAGVELLAADG